MNIKISNVITISDPTEEVKAWCKKNLELDNPDYVKKSRMGFWTGNTPKKLNLYEWRGTDLVVPFGCINDMFPLFKNAYTETDFAKIPVDYGDSEIPLYDYQQTAVDNAAIGGWGILQAPAGSGKTQMGIAMIKKWGRRALWLTHTKDLLNQSKERTERYLDPSLMGTITEGKVNIGTGITFATVQTMCRLDLSQYKYMWDVIIVDECHRCTGTPTAVTQFSRVLNALAARHKYGLSATVHRSDGLIRATYALLGNIVYSVPESAVADRVMRVGIQPVGTGIQIGHGCLNTDGTINYARLLNYLCESDERNEVITQKIMVNNGRPSLILSDRLVHLENLMNLLPDDMKEDACMVSGQMTSVKAKKEREQALEDMRTGKKKYLFATYSLAKEGLDIPCLERLYLTTPHNDYAVITQSIGRIARVSKEKSDPICYDFVDNIQYLVKSYKKRCRIYKKNQCWFLEEVSR